SLSLYYYTFVDLLDYRDHVGELLTTLDACRIVMDITRNFDLSKAYLSVVSTYASLMIFLSRVEDRRLYSDSTTPHTKGSTPTPTWPFPD
ncbi:Uncharacterized protein FKW44_008694, partial [Caligus rogercresseyi]